MNYISKKRMLQDQSLDQRTQKTLRNLQHSTKLSHAHQSRDLNFLIKHICSVRHLLQPVNMTISKYYCIFPLPGKKKKN